MKAPAGSPSLLRTSCRRDRLNPCSRSSTPLCTTCILSTGTPSRASCSRTAPDMHTMAAALRPRSRPIHPSRVRSRTCQTAGTLVNCAGISAASIAAVVLAWITRGLVLSTIHPTCSIQISHATTIRPCCPTSARRTGSNARTRNHRQAPAPPTFRPGTWFCFLSRPRPASGAAGSLSASAPSSGATPKRCCLGVFARPLRGSDMRLSPPALATPTVAPRRANPATSSCRLRSAPPIRLDTLTSSTSTISFRRPSRRPARLRPA